jgi:hypothetical protein
VIDANAKIQLMVGEKAGFTLFGLACITVVHVLMLKAIKTTEDEE